MTELVFDRYGTNPDNYITDELVEISNSTARVIVPLKGAIFKDDFELRIASSGSVLTLGTHYKWVSLDPVLTGLTGKDVVNGVILTEGPGAVYSDVYMDYRAVGGKEGRSSVLIKKLREAVEKVDREGADYNLLSNLPSQWPPEPHDHSMLEDLTNLEPLRESMQGIWDALTKQRPISTSHQEHEDFVRRLMYLLAEQRNELNELVFDFQGLVSQSELTAVQQSVTAVDNKTDYKQLHFVRTLADLPDPDAGVIIFEAGHSYIFCPQNGVFDFEGNRVTSNGPVNIRGVGSGVTTLKSTGVETAHPGKAFFTFDHNVILEDFKYDHLNQTTPVFIYGTVTPNLAFFADTFNITNAPNIGTFKDCSAVAFVSGYFINSQEMAIDGSTLTVLIERCGFFPPAGTGRCVHFPATCVVNRRVSTSSSTFQLQAGVTGFSAADPDTSFPNNESLVIQDSLFTNGIQLSANLINSAKVEIVHSHGVEASGCMLQYHMENNATPTPITATGEAVPVAGTFTLNRSKKFEQVGDNEYIYIGGESAYISMDATGSVTTGVNNEIVRLEIERSVDAGGAWTQIPGAVARAKVRTAGDPYPISVAYGAVLNPQDRVRVAVANQSSSGDVTVIDLATRMIREAT